MRKVHREDEVPALERAGTLCNATSVLRSLLLASLLASTLVSCQAASDSFPTHDQTAPLRVSDNTASPSATLCVISDARKVELVLDQLAKRYSRGWKPAAPVTYAPNHTVTWGSNELLILKNGMILSASNSSSVSRRRHPIDPRESTKLARDICKMAST